MPKKYLTANGTVHESPQVRSHIYTKNILKALGSVSEQDALTQEAVESCVNSIKRGSWLCECYDFDHKYCDFTREELVVNVECRAKT